MKACLHGETSKDFCAPSHQVDSGPVVSLHKTSKGSWNK